MCGIIGIIAPTPEVFLPKMLDAIQHRGPDSHGSWHDAYIALGHQRLAIQDLSPTGYQPKMTADGRYVLIFNGEIYNHFDIRAKIADKYPFTSHADTDTVLYGFVEYGVDLFRQLNGIFALAIYDTHTGEVVLARDQFGIKPLYYYQKNDVLIFGSEIKSFVQYPYLDKTLDMGALYNYLLFLWSPGSQTPFKEVRKLEGGQYIRFKVHQPSQYTIDRYYEIPFVGEYAQLSEAELINLLDEKLEKAVARQLLSDVPVGFFLSGGLDSSAIVAMAKKAQPNQRLKCYTIDTTAFAKDGFSNDLEYAQQVAKYLDVDLEIVSSNPDILQDFDKMIYHLDEPQADLAPLHVLNICKAARRDGYVVLLGGTGGDDLFSGYRRHQALRYEPIFNAIPAPIRRLLRAFAAKLPYTNAALRRIRKLLSDIDKTSQERLFGFFQWLPAKQIIEWFSPKYRDELQNYDPYRPFKNALAAIPHEQNILNHALMLELKYFLADHNLNYTDKLSMAVGVEVRVPFLDLELVEFSTQIPPNLKMKGITTKYLFRKVMERYLPHEVIYRSKAGFGAPIREWINHDFLPIINDYLSKESIAARGIFDYNTLQQILKDNKNGKIDAACSILAALAIESWLRQFADPIIATETEAAAAHIS